MLKNYMEDVVEYLLPDVLNEYDEICKCQKCIDDIKAVALNHLNPLYFTSQKGEVYNKLNGMEMQFEADALREITKAIEMVSKRSKHKI